MSGLYIEAYYENSELSYSKIIWDTNTHSL